jgi:diguanylate cyclase (GGDEF)-like protein
LQATDPNCPNYWVRIPVSVGKLPPGGWILEMKSWWWRADIYYEADGQWRQLPNGSALTPAQRILVSDRLIFPLVLGQGQQRVFYLHLEGDTSRYGSARKITGQFLRLDRFQAEQRDELFLEGIYAGIMLALVLYNLVLFFSLLERTYLFYSLYVLLCGSFWTGRTDFDHQYLWPNCPAWSLICDLVEIAAALVFATLFVRSFLDTRRRMRGFDRVLLAVLGAAVPLGVAAFFFPREPVAVLLAVLTLFTMFLFAATGIVSLRKGFRPARYFLLAWTVLLLTNAIYALSFLRLFPGNFVTSNSAQIGSALECILLAFALADRVTVMKRKQEETQLHYTHELEQEVGQRTSQLQAAVDRLRIASITDPLTQLHNRRYVESAVKPWVAEIERNQFEGARQNRGAALLICLVDLDRFKQINDRYGHPAGDEVLQATAAVLRRTVRGTTILARWGGEEFLIVDRIQAREDDLQAAARLHQALLEQPARSEFASSVTGSIGVVRYPFSIRYPQLLSWDQMLALADSAMYEAKRSGRNCWRSLRPNEDVLHQAISDMGAATVQRILLLDLAKAMQLELVEIVSQLSKPSAVAAAARGDKPL